MTRTLIVVGTINKYPPPGEDWRVVHVDASDRGIWDPELGRNVPVDVVADMRSLPFPDSSVDRVQCWHALEHVNQHGGETTVAEFARVLKPGGVLDVEVPNLEWLAQAQPIEKYLPVIYGDQFEMQDSELNVHRWGYTPGSLRDLLERHGFACEIEAVEGDLRARGVLR